MNEQRIRELAEQASTHAEETVHYYMGQFDGLTWEAKILKARDLKFAELLVKECASICEINGQSYKHSFTPAKARLAESTSNHCAMMINKHFGVEE